MGVSPLSTPPRPHCSPEFPPTVFPVCVAGLPGDDWVPTAPLQALRLQRKPSRSGLGGTYCRAVTLAHSEPQRQRHPVARKGPGPANQDAHLEGQTGGGCAPWRSLCQEGECPQPGHSGLDSGGLSPQPTPSPLGLQPLQTPHHVHTQGLLPQRCPLPHTVPHPHPLGPAAPRCPQPHGALCPASRAHTESRSLLPDTEAPGRWARSDVPYVQSRV